jgi:hypothetical protein
MSTYQNVDDYFDSDLYPSMLNREAQDMPVRLELLQDLQTLSAMLFASTRICVLRFLFWFLRNTYRG